MNGDRDSFNILTFCVCFHVGINETKAGIHDQVCVLLPQGGLPTTDMPRPRSFSLALRARWGMLCSGLWHSRVCEHLAQTQVRTSSLGDLHVGKEAGAGNV